MKEKFINPLADRGFKIIFGHDEFMREFLNDLLQPTSPIKELTFLDKEVVPKMEKEHGVIFDLYCTTEGNDHFIVECSTKSTATSKNGQYSTCHVSLMYKTVIRRKRSDKNGITSWCPYMEYLS